MTSALRIQVYGETSAGRRDENQDAFYAEVFKRPRGCLRALAVVSDGMGGHEGGRIASQTAIQVVRRWLRSPPDRDKEVENWIHSLTGAIHDALQTLASKKPNLDEMGATLVLGAVGRAFIWIAHIGDSRAYGLDAERAHLLTRDHTAVQEAIDRGVYTEDEIRGNENMRAMSSALSRWLGPSEEAEPQIARFNLVEGVAFLFCSDGLTGSVLEAIVTPHEIHDLVSCGVDLEQSASDLLSLAYQNGSTDNITAALLEIGEFPRQPLAAPLPSIYELMGKPRRAVWPEWLTAATRGLLAFFALGLSCLLVFLLYVLIHPMLHGQPHARLRDVIPQSTSLENDTETAPTLEPQSKGRLYVKPVPAEAKARIVEVGPLEEEGMALEPGRYELEVSHQHYQTWREWVEVVAGEEVILNPELQRLSPRPVPTPQSPPEFNGGDDRLDGIPNTNRNEDAYDGN